MINPWPTTQRFLLDHLRRIVEDVTCIDQGDDENERWFFGYGKDALVTAGPCEGEEYKDYPGGNIDLFLMSLGVEFRDRLGGPASERSQRFRKFFENPKKARAILDLALSDSSDDDTWQKAYAYEMLCKLDDMVKRGRASVRTMSLTELVPEEVDDYVGEASACFRYGFDRGCLAMCRVALEEALRQRIIHDHGDQAVHTVDPATRRVVDKDLKTLIFEADKQHEILGPFRREADKIRKWGNECLHGKLPPHRVRKHAQEALRSLRFIVGQLYT